MMMLNAIVLVVVLMMAQLEGVSSRTISSRNHESGAKHDELQQHHQIEARDSSRISTSLQPFYVSNSNTVYGGYSSKSLKLDTKNEFNIGPINFYKQDLYGYIKDGVTPKNGIFGFAAHFDASTPDYTFFKSISNNKLQAKNSSSNKKKRTIQLLNNKNSKDSNLIQKRQDDRVQCRNQSGDSVLFSMNECLSAAIKMTSEKTAMSTCGGCQLMMIGPQGQLSSSNMPANDLQTHTSNILNGCVTGRRFDSSKSNKNSLSSIPQNLKPTFVLLLTQGSGPSCN